MTGQRFGAGSIARVGALGGTASGRLPPRPFPSARGRIAGAAGRRERFCLRERLPGDSSYLLAGLCEKDLFHNRILHLHSVEEDERFPAAGHRHAQRARGGEGTKIPAVPARAEERDEGQQGARGHAEGSEPLQYQKSFHGISLLMKITSGAGAELRAKWADARLAAAFAQRQGRTRGLGAVEPQGAA